jgi:hypothetical protein
VALGWSVPSASCLLLKGLYARTVVSRCGQQMAVLYALRALSLSLSLSLSQTLTAPLHALRRCTHCTHPSTSNSRVSLRWSKSSGLFVFEELLVCYSAKSSGPPQRAHRG